MEIILVFVGIYAVMKVVSWLVSKATVNQSAPVNKPSEEDDDMEDFIDRIEELDAMLDDTDDE